MDATIYWTRSIILARRLSQLITKSRFVLSKYNLFSHDIHDICSIATVHFIPMNWIFYLAG